MAPGTAPGFGEKKGLSLNSAGDSSCPLPPPCTCPGLRADSTTDHFLLWGLRSEIGVWLDPGGRTGPSQPLQLQLWPLHSGLPCTLPGLSTA